MENKKIHVIGGGTISHVRAHLGLVAEAYGETATLIADMARGMQHEMEVRLHLTRMAGGGKGAPSTYEDMVRLVDRLTADLTTQIIFFTAAIVDFHGQIDDVPSGRYAKRLKSRDVPPPVIQLSPAEKIVKKIRATRKDITLVVFKSTDGATVDEQYLAGLNLLKESSANLVLANDVVTRTNMIITPEEARYHVTTNRDEVLRNLIDMTLLRSHLTFTRSTVVRGDAVPWESPEVPEALRTVVNHCIARGAYKPFRGATVGHFACKLDETTFLTSRRKTNFNDLPKLGLVKVVTDGPDTVLAYGAKPSVGGQSQRIIFHDHPGMDCIVHFHCPMKVNPRDVIPVRSQREYECGSHECGKNTSHGLGEFGNLKTVMLDQHGPNIVFNHAIDPQEVIDFIEANFDLTDKTGGLVS